MGRKISLGRRKLANKELLSSIFRSQNNIEYISTMNLHHVFYHVLPALLLCSRVAHQSDLETIQVRLINGSSHYEGTIQYSGDNGLSWHSVCGVNLDINAVKVICRQLGFSGANRNIQNSPFGIGNEVPTTGFNCAGGEQTIGACNQYNISCLSSGRQPGAAVCYDKRYLGCFNDLPNNRVLRGNRQDSDVQSIDSCIKYCMSYMYKYVYAGIKDGNQCYCGDASADYGSQGMVGDDGCQLLCSGDGYSSCGGNGKIAIFNLSVVIPPSDTTTTDTTTTDTTTTDATLVTTNSTITTHPETTTGLEDTNTATTSTKLALYAGAGVGGSFLLISIIVIIVVFVKYKQRKMKRDAPVSAQEMVSMDVEDKKNNEYELISYDVSSNDHSHKDAPIPDPAALYAMPDLSAKSSSNKSRTDAPPDQTADLSLLYALPYKQTTTNAADVGALYSVSKVKKGNHVTSDGVGMHAPLEEYDIHADDEEDNTVMIANEIYNC